MMQSHMIPIVRKAASLLLWCKQQEVLIRALKSLPDNYVVWLIGDGVRRRECENIAESLGVSDRVNFWGVRTDVPRLLKTSDVVVMSTHYEGMSLSNIEGMSSGKPFVASNVNGIREITEGAGILFEENNDKQLAQIILRLERDQAYHDKVVEQCLARANRRVSRCLQFAEREPLTTVLSITFVFL